MKLIQTIQALRNASPGQVSEMLHKEFQEALNKTEFDVDALKLALDEAKFKDEIGMKDAVAEVLCTALRESVNHNKDIDALLYANKYIEAVKLYRTTFRTGLADSKAAVDLRKAQLGIK